MDFLDPLGLDLDFFYKSGQGGEGREGLFTFHYFFGLSINNYPL